MHMGIDESRSDEPPTKIDYGMPGRYVSRGLIAADEADGWTVGHHGSRPAVARRVHAAPDEDHELVLERCG